MNREKTILDLLPIAVYRSTPDGRIVDANPAMVAMLGYPDRDSLLAASARTLYADPAERERVMARAEREGHLRGIETQLRRRDGRVFWARLNTFVEHGPDGRTLFYVGAIEDVTERRLAEDALWESEARSRMLLEQLPAVLWTTDTELRSTLSEGAGLKSIGLRPNQLRGTKIGEYMGDTEEAASTLAVHRRALQGEVLSYRQDWNGRAFEAHLRPLYGEDRSIVGTLGMALDVTDKIRLEDVGRLAAGFAEELGALLDEIVGDTETALVRMHEDDPARSRVAQTLKSARRAAALAGQLLAVIREQAPALGPAAPGPRPRRRGQR